MHFYYFQSKYPKIKNFTRGFKKIIESNNIKGKLLLSATRYAFDSSDNTSWILNYENKNQLEIDKQKLINIKFNSEPIFNVTGNGFGTGLYISMNYRK